MNEKLHLTNGIFGNIEEAKRLPNLIFPEMADELEKIEKEMKKRIAQRRKKQKFSLYESCIS